MNTAEMIALVRTDLHDEDADNYRWTDDELTRHINRAVLELSYAIPREMRATLHTTNGSRSLSIAALTDRIIIRAVEYPTGKYPQSYVRFSIWMDTLEMLMDTTPGDAEDVYVYYGAYHLLGDSSCTFLKELYDVVALGAGAYALIAWAAYAINKSSVGGDDTPREFRLEGERRLKRFQGELKRRGRQNRIRARILYVPAQPPVDKTTDFGP
jgi:hypothetical protein